VAIFTWSDEKWYTHVFIVRKSRPVSLDRQEILRCGKIPLLLQTTTLKNHSR